MKTLLTVLFLLVSSIIGTVEASASNIYSSNDIILQQVPVTFTAQTENKHISAPMEPVAQSSVVLAIDVSDSMYGLPLDEAKKLAHYIVNVLDDETAISIVTFANSAEIAHSFTTDKRALNAIIEALHTQGVTALYDGVSEAVKLAAQTEAGTRTVILLSDGGEYGGQSTASRQDALQLAQTHGVSIMTVGIGAWTDSDYLQELARTTSGEVFEVPHVSGLIEIYEPLVAAVFASEAQPTTVAQASPTIPPLATAAPIDDAANLPDTSRQFASTLQFVNAPKFDVPAAIAPIDQTDSDFDEVTRAMSPTTQRGNSALVLVIDVSDSMYGLPLERVSELTQTLVRDLNGTMPIAIVTFASQAELVQDFTTDQDALLAVLDSLQTQGVTALYDAVDLAVDVAASANVSNRVVVLLSDGGEYGDQSTATRDQGLTAARANNVQIVTLGYGQWIDADYLTALADGTGSPFFHADVITKMEGAFSDLTGYLGELPTTTVVSADVETAVVDVFETDDTALNVPIPAISGEIASLNLPAPDRVAEMPPAITDAIEPIAVNDTDPIITPNLVENPADDLVDEVTELQAEGGITSNIMPITIEVSDETDVLQADLVLNGFQLATFDTAPFTYDLDLSLLNDGLYKLTLQLQDMAGDTRIVNSEFEVEVIEDVSPLAQDTTTAAPIVDETASPRIVMIDGQATELTYTYTQADGLVHVGAPVPQTVNTVDAEPQTLGEILTSPLQHIPEPVRLALTTPNPDLVAAIIVIMTIVLIPPGLFTLYYMMYSWNHPDKLEESRSPKEFIDPQYSFTAIVPARKEEQVIRQTIHSVNNIDYPDHLKEILIMIRDEDDDETIAEAHRAIEEIGKDNIRVITFKDGPKNKPNGLNRGLRAAQNDVVCIFDAEDEPHPEIYHVVNTVMVQKQADVIQSGVQLMNFDSNWFSAFNVLEYFFWFKSGLHAFTRQFKVTPLGGNTVFFKREWLEAIDGWDESCLTEDADVGLRLTQLGAKIEIVYDEKHATQEETPDTAESFIKQRTRWVQGFYQIFFKGDWAKLPTLTQKVVAVYILLNSLLQAAMLIFLPIGIYIAATQRIPVPLALLSYLPIYILFIQLATNLIGIREFTAAYNKRLPLFFSLKMIIYYYPYQLMLAFAALRAVYRMVIGQAAWEKTAHSNLHRVALES